MRRYRVLLGVWVVACVVGMQARAAEERPDPLRQSLAASAEAMKNTDAQFYQFSGMNTLPAFYDQLVTPFLRSEKIDPAGIEAICLWKGGLAGRAGALLFTARQVYLVQQNMVLSTERNREPQISKRERTPEITAALREAAKLWAGQKGGFGGTIVHDVPVFWCAFAPAVTGTKEYAAYYLQYPQRIPQERAPSRLEPAEAIQRSNALCRLLELAEPAAQPAQQ